VRRARGIDVKKRRPRRSIGRWIKRAVFWTDWHTKLTRAEAERFIFDLRHGHPLLFLIYESLRIKLLNRRPLSNKDYEVLETLVHCLLTVRKRGPGRPRKTGEMPAWYEHKLDSQRKKYLARKKS